MLLAPCVHVRVGFHVQSGRLLSQVPISESLTLIGRGKTESAPVSPKVQLWVCDDSLSPEHASLGLSVDRDALCVEDLYSGTITCFLHAVRVG